jgi:hypothetical protein
MRFSPARGRGLLACRSLKGHGADQPTAASFILVSVVDLISTALESLSGSRNEAYRFSLARDLRPALSKVVELTSQLLPPVSL